MSPALISEYGRSEDGYTFCQTRSSGSWSSHA